MKAIIVDDEPSAVESLLAQCTRLSEIDEVKGFTDAESALAYAGRKTVDLALLDIHMPDMDGITLAARIREIQPEVEIVFQTAYRKYAFDAFAVHPSGYLLKPVSFEKLAEEVRYLSGSPQREEPVSIQVRTFGNFDLYVNELPVSFSLARSKEILAYLVDKQGAGVTRADLFAAVWEDRPYDRKQQKQLDVYIRSLRKTLKEYGVEGIMEMKKGILRVKPDAFDCDAYRFYAGDSDVINAYRGEYMSSYSWASMTEGILLWKAVKE